MNIYVLLEQLKRHEGFRSYAYSDSLGFLTIGYGRLIDRRRGGGISIDEATMLLSNDVRNTTRQLEQALPWWKDLDDVRQRVLANMAFNLGVPGLLKFRKTLAHVQAGEYEQASEQMKRSLWATQVGDRADELAIMMKTGKDLVQ